MSTVTTKAAPKKPAYDFWKGMLRENPSFVLLLGMCPTLGITTSIWNGFGMGVATALVIVASNWAVSMLKRVIPEMVRIPAYIVIIAGFVTILQLAIKAFMPDLDKALGIFIPLIVANCIVLGRAEAFAAKNSAWLSVLDGASNGIGIIFALSLLGAIREILATGALFAGTPLYFKFIAPDADGIMGFGMAPGSFIVLGFVIAILNWQQRRSKARKAARKEAEKAALATASVVTGGNA